MANNLNSYSRSQYSGIIFLISSAILFLGAIGLFIWLLVDAAEDRLVKNILYGSAFLVITFGVLIYSLCVMKAPRTATTIMWVTMGLGIATFIVGLCLKTPEHQVVIETSYAPRPDIVDTVLSDTFKN